MEIENVNVNVCLRVAHITQQRCPSAVAIATAQQATTFPGTKRSVLGKKLLAAPHDNLQFGSTTSTATNTTTTTSNDNADDANDDAEADTDDDEDNDDGDYNDGEDDDEYDDI